MVRLEWTHFFRSLAEGFFTATSADTMSLKATAPAGVCDVFDYVENCHTCLVTSLANLQ